MSFIFSLKIMNWKPYGEDIWMQNMVWVEPTHNMFVDGVNLPKWVASSFPNHVLEVVDRSLLRNMLFRIKHPCNLGSRVTNLLLTCRQSAFYNEWKENRKKVLTYLINDDWSKLDLLSLHFSPKLLGMHLSTYKEQILQVISHAYIY